MAGTSSTASCMGPRVGQELELSVLEKDAGERTQAPMAASELA